MYSSPESSQRGLVLATILLGFFVINEICFRDILYSTSLEYIETLQKDMPQETFKFIFEVFCMVGDPEIVGPIFFLYFSFQVNKYTAIKLLLYLSGSSYLLSILKLVYSNPRPYWVDQKIIPMESYAEYGNPSGHAFIFVSIYGFIYFTYQKKNRIDQNRRQLLNDSELGDSLSTEYNNSNAKIDLLQEKMHPNSQDEDKGFKNYRSKLFQLIFTIWFFGLCIGRSYLGMHTYNQVLLGVIYGSYVCYILINFVDPKVDQFLYKILKQEEKNKPLLLWSFGLLYMIAALIPIVLFISCDINNPINESDVWTDYWLVVQNDIVGITPAKFAYNKCFLDTSIIGAFFGTMLGLLTTEGEFSNKEVSINAIPKVKLMLRVLLAFVVFGIGASIFFMMPTRTPDYILMYFINQNLALFAGIFFIIKFVPHIYSKFQLDVEGDFLRVFNK